MPVQITVRNVPDEVRDELAARAARRGKSMQEYLYEELCRLVARPAIDELSDRIRQRKARSGTRLDTGDILSARDQDRR
jgi:hypothetical protein